MYVDAIDKKLMGALLVDARQSFTQLARQATTSREVAKYRYARLEKSFKLKPFTIVDYERLGYKKYVFFLQLKNISPEEETTFMNFLVHHPFVTYMGPLIGKWNVAFDILVRNEDHFKKVVDEIITAAHPYVESYVTNGVSMEQQVYHEKFFAASSPVKKQKTKSLKLTPDTVDKKILSLLTNNARIEYAFLAKKLKLSANAIKYRIKRLEQSGIIKGYTVSFDFHKLGVEAYVLQLKWGSLTDSKLKEFLKIHPKVFFYYRYVGQEYWDVDIGLYVSSPLELREFIVELKQEFGDAIKIHNMYVIAGIIKDNIPPKGLFK